MRCTDGYAISAIWGVGEGLGNSVCKRRCGWVLWEGSEASYCERALTLRFLEGPLKMHDTAPCLALLPLPLLTVQAASRRGGQECQASLQP